MVRERERARRRKLVSREPPHLGDVVGGHRLAHRSGPPGQPEDEAVEIRLDERAKKVGGLDHKPGLFEQLASKPGERLLALVEETAGKIPLSNARIAIATSEQHASVANDERLHRRRGVRVDDEPAACTGGV